MPLPLRPCSWLARTVSRRSISTRAPIVDEKTWPHPIHASERIIDKRSVFLAHASTLPNASALPEFLSFLQGRSALKKATHCMYAFRTQDPTTSQIVQGQNDGGEGGSGDRLSRLLELSGSQNVVVVVSRWYGGVKLGSDRWKRISDTAKQALEAGGFICKASDSSPKSSSKGKKKKRG